MIITDTQMQQQQPPKNMFTIMGLVQPAYPRHNTSINHAYSWFSFNLYKNRIQISKEWLWIHSFSRPIWLLFVLGKTKIKTVYECV